MDNLHAQAPDQRSTRLILKHLDRLERLGSRAHEEMKEIRSLFADLLGSCQSDIAMEDSGGYDSTIDSQTGLDGPQGILPRSSTDHEPTAQHFLAQPQYSMYSEACSAFHGPRVSESSLRGANPRLGQFSQDLLLPGMSDHAYNPAVQPCQGIYVDPLGFSAGPNELSVPVVQTNQVVDKVKCSWNGCSAFINKGGLTRHCDEVHEGKIKAVCADCKMGFKRRYQLAEHRECRGS